MHLKEQCVRILFLLNICLNLITPQQQSKNQTLKIYIYISVAIAVIRLSNQVIRPE